MLETAADYDCLYRHFAWPAQPRFNIAAACCDRHAEARPDHIAILDVAADFTVNPWSFSQLRRAADGLSHALVADGLKRGDRVAILLPQGPLVAAAHLAVYKIGAVALPLAALFGADAITFRLKDAGARALITDEAGWNKVRPSRADLLDLHRIVSVDGDADEAIALARFIEGHDRPLATLDTAANDPAMMIYTSGTTGQPKGALHAHRVLLGHLPGMQMTHDFLPQPGDRTWTPSDWAWAGGLLNIMLPSLYFAVPVVSRRVARFDPGEALALLARLDIRNAFIPPTALRLIRAHLGDRPAGAALRTMASGGEALGAEVLAWGAHAFGLTINELYGQTECNYIVASSAALGVSRPGAIGKPVPGHVVTVIRDDGGSAAPGEIGQIAVRRPDPALFLGYWGREQATREKFIGDWMTTGDQGTRDEDGYISFVGRDDDVITSAGFRIGPGEIEDCLIKHPAVALAAVVGIPDPMRTEIVKAFVVLKPGFAPDTGLAADIQSFVRTRLSAHEYPRIVAFIDELPLTTTGKVIRRLLREKI